MATCYKLSMVNLYIFLACVLHIYGITSYEWGYDVTELTQTVVYKDVIILPDPELVAPVDGKINFLHFFNVENDKFFKLVLLRSTSTSISKSYQVKQVSDYIHAKRYGVRDVDLRGKRLFADKYDVVGFFIFDMMPIPYRDKVPCSGAQNHLVHNVTKVELKPGDNLDFISQATCLQFSYVMEVANLEPTTTVSRVERNDITDAQRNVEPIPDQNSQSGSSIDVTKRESGDPRQQERCDATVSNCDALTSDGDGDLYRYVIFGPLIVLWIIVSVICSVKLKRRLPCWRRQVVTPAPLHGSQPPRRSRFGRVTLSRAPPNMMMNAQPKPELTPSAALPPYPGLDSRPPQPPYSGYPPSYPPPAYTPKEVKEDQKSVTHSGSTSEEEIVDSDSPSEHIESINDNIDITHNPEPSHHGQASHVVAGPASYAASGPASHVASGGATSSQNQQENSHQERTHNAPDGPPEAPPISSPWVGGYSMGMVPMQESFYPGPPPTYQEATETHM